VTNATIGLLMAVKALDLRGRVIVPAFTFPASVQALTWAGVAPAFCDVDPQSQQLDVAAARAQIGPGVSAILGVNLWGGACAIAALADLAREYGLRLFFDSAHAFGCRLGGVAIGNFGDLEVFSFHATKILSATEGGCICTNDDILAARLRNIRSSYGAGVPTPVPLTSNGRMSEAQAAVGLMSLDDFPQILARNRQLHERYRAGLAPVPGLLLYAPSGVDTTNYQYMVARIDAARFGLSRDQLLAALKAENINVRRYFHPGMHRALPYVNELPGYRDALPATDLLCNTSIQFPLGALVSEDTVDRICARVAAAHGDAARVRAALGGP
jgi:dTDP-4-amino-4,6-dideoxygalactose transaminase